jgi:hypothetical protein
VVNGKLHLQNKINREEFKVLVIPSCKTISISNLKKIRDLYEQGGSIVFTTRLPSKSVETGKDLEVNQLVKSIFPEGENSEGVVQTSSNGGKAILIGKPSEQNLRQSLLKVCGNFDIDYPVNEDIRYIHRVINGQEIYYFANIGAENVHMPVTLRGNMKLQKWDPHTGSIQDLITENISSDKARLSTTKGTLNLKPYQSCFWIGNRRN